MTGRHELVATALAGAVGAALVAGFAGRTWATFTQRGGIDTLALQPLTGRSLSGVTGALGWAGLAGLAALFATRGWARVAVGALLAGLGAVVAVATPLAVRHAHVVAVAREKSTLAQLGGVTVHVTGWWTVSLAGGVLLALAGLVTVVRGQRWPGLSARYDRAGAPPARSADDPAALWRSLDRGEDPTSHDARH